MAEFGEPMKEQFVLSRDYTFINHGSYGAVAKPAHDAKLRKQTEFDAAPDRWFRRTYEKDYMDNVQAAANFLAVPPENTVLVNNTTTGINAVMRSLKFTSEDAILITTWTYGAIKNTVTWVAERSGTEILMIDIHLPISDKQNIIDAYRDMIIKHSNIKLAIVDGICSVPPVLMPYRELTSLCQEHGILVLLDGAHTPGQLDVHLDTWQPEFFVGNLHKWMYTSRGCAVLCVKPCHHGDVVPTVTSAVLGGDDIRRRFFYQGTDDSTTFCAVKDALTFYRDIGGLDAVSQYNTDLVTRAADMLMTRWGTRSLDIPRDMEAPYMRMIRVPDLKAFLVEPWIPGDISTLISVRYDMMLALMERFHIVVMCCSLEGLGYVRISANIYNTLQDYVKLADAVLELKQQEL